MSELQQNISIVISLLPLETHAAPCTARAVQKDIFFAAAITSKKKSMPYLRNMGFLMIYR